MIFYYFMFSPSGAGRVPTERLALAPLGARTLAPRRCAPFRLFFLLALLLLTAACPQLPQPFQHDQANPLLLLDGRAGVFLAFDESAPAALLPALRAALMKQDVPVFLDKPPAEALPLRLKLRKAAPRADTVELELFWELYDSDGLVIDHYDQKLRVVVADWDKGVPALMKRLADEAAPHIARLMPVEEGTRQDEAATPGPRPRLFVAAVEGAPGDGNDAMARAMRLSLSASGIELVERPGEGIFQLKGKAAVARADSKSEKLQVEWTLLDPRGGEMASMDQAGLVPLGLLHKPWGTLAGEIVAGTAIELAGLLKDAAKPRKKP